ncbi:MAG: L-histidine N(alpha)-methyltransferase [Okeania sp. SIO2F4]|uniref:L-histidine N(alpha)-methyltransferase n=1 Tax=Okeania sp. SIO2F4 TaxID=2607790 RepID=UPI001429F5A2|nr:L-histidine N(alpha)-methyltransferase [Okeania sp. SIO2F4]NES06601.1 L-histidine N(alpha)-methyltransferase [Okeania sp. SIO2F4]
MSYFYQSFLCDVKSLFLRQQEENLGAYLYSTPNPDIKDDPANGEAYYLEIISQNLDYYLYKEETQLINDVASKIATYVPAESNLIEFGPGTDIAFKNKTLPFLKEIKQFNSYIPIDLCETYLEQSEEILSRELPNISVQPIKTDFIKNVDIVKNFSLPVVFFKGSTINNLSTNDCINFLGKISQAIKPNGILIIGVDANQNESSLRKAYDNSKVAKFILSILYYINRDLPISDFDPTAFNYEFNWVAETHCVEHNVIAIKEQNFILDGIPRNIKSGEKFHFLSSYKYPMDYFKNIAIKAG